MNTNNTKNVVAGQTVKEARLWGHASCGKWAVSMDRRNTSSKHVSDDDGNDNAHLHTIRRRVHLQHTTSFAASSLLVLINPTKSTEKLSTTAKYKETHIVPNMHSWMLRMLCFTHSETVVMQVRCDNCRPTRCLQRFSLKTCLMHSMQRTLTPPERIATVNSFKDIAAWNPD